MELVAVTQVLTEDGGQSNAQNEIASGPRSAVSGPGPESPGRRRQLLEEGAGGSEDGGEPSGAARSNRTATRTDQANRSRRLLKWEIKQLRKEMATSELKRKRRRARTADGQGASKGLARQRFMADAEFGQGASGPPRSAVEVIDRGRGFIFGRGP